MTQMLVNIMLKLTAGNLAVVFLVFPLDVINTARCYKYRSMLLIPLDDINAQWYQYRLMILIPLDGINTA